MDRFMSDVLFIAFTPVSGFRRAYIVTHQGFLAVCVAFLLFFKVFRRRGTTIAMQKVGSFISYFF
jgi:hypothetical protein